MRNFGRKDGCEEEAKNCGKSDIMILVGSKVLNVFMRGKAELPGWHARIGRDRQRLKKERKFGDMSIGRLVNA
jgi:hypothetical protein